MEISAAGVFLYWAGKRSGDFDGMYRENRLTDEKADAAAVEKTGIKIVWAGVKTLRKRLWRR